MGVSHCGPVARAGIIGHTICGPMRVSVSHRSMIPNAIQLEDHFCVVHSYLNLDGGGHCVCVPAVSDDLAVVSACCLVQFAGGRVVEPWLI